MFSSLYKINDSLYINLNHITSLQIEPKSNEDKKFNLLITLGCDKPIVLEFSDKQEAENLANSIYFKTAKLKPPIFG